MPTTTPLKHIAGLLDSAEVVVALLERLDRLTDRLVSVGELRFRAEVARRKARNSRNKILAAAWARRARKLTERADRIEASR